MQAPRDDLIRGIAPCRSAEGEEGVMVGYPIVFDTWTEINSWEGRFRERIHPGAVTKTVRERADQVKVLFNHGMDPQIGDKPLGKPRTMEVQQQGLWTETPLDDTSYNADLKALLRSGALDGMSFRFSVVREEWDKEDTDLPERTIIELKLHEFGPVTFPAYAATQVGMRGAPAMQLWRDTPDEGRRQLLEQFGMARHLDPTEPQDHADQGAADDGTPDPEVPPPGEDPDAPAEGHPSPPANRLSLTSIRGALADMDARMAVIQSREERYR